MSMACRSVRCHGAHLTRRTGVSWIQRRQGIIACAGFCMHDYSTHEGGRRGEGGSSLGNGDGDLRARTT